MEDHAHELELPARERSSGQCYAARMAPETPPTDYPFKYTMDEVLMIAGAFFAGESPVHRAQRAIARRLTDLGVPFVVAGGMALGRHGHVRVTDDVDLIVRREDWQRFKERWLGLGYVEVFKGSKAVRDMEENVKIDVLFTGEFPGDGKPKPVSFPDPRDVVAAGLVPPTVSLQSLVQLKLASGKTAIGRQLHDWNDVVKLIRANRLDESFADQLDPYVRAEFLALLVNARAPDQPPE